MELVEDIQGKVVLITGAVGGLGSLMVKTFLEEGAKHVAIIDLAEDAGKEFEEKLRTQYGEDKAKFHKCDVTKDDQLFAAFDNTLEKHGSLDVVINNAGIMNDREDIYKKQIEVNVTALVTGTLKALKVMGKDHGGQGGTIINISSAIALFMDTMLPIYSATKSAVLMFSNCMGLDSMYQRTGVRVLTLCFGPTDTKLFDDALKQQGGLNEEISKELEEKSAAIPFQKPESAVRAVIEAFKFGQSGDTWMASFDKPPRNITPKIKEAYGILTELAFET